MRTIAVTNHKGGSAKTTTAVNLAAALGEGGRRVLVIDMDPQGSATSWLGVVDPQVTVVDAIRGREKLAHLVYETTAPGVQLVPASPALVASSPSDETDIALGFMRAMERLPPIWDVVFVDSPPSLGYLSLAPLTVCGELLVPVEAHALALAGIKSLLETVDRIQRRLNPGLRVTGVVACRVNRTSHTRAVAERLARRFPDEFMQTQIRESIRLAEAPSFRLPITIYAPGSTGAEDHRALAAELFGPPLFEVGPVAAEPEAVVPLVAPGRGTGDVERGEVASAVAGPYARGLPGPGADAVGPTGGHGSPDEAGRRQGAHQMSLLTRLRRSLAAAWREEAR